MGKYKYIDEFNRASLYGEFEASLPSEFNEAPKENIQPIEILLPKDNNIHSESYDDSSPEEKDDVKPSLSKKAKQKLMAYSIAATVSVVAVAGGPGLSSIFGGSDAIFDNAVPGYTVEATEHNNSDNSINHAINEAVHRPAPDDFSNILNDTVPFVIPFDDQLTVSVGEEIQYFVTGETVIRQLTYNIDDANIVNVDTLSFGKTSEVRITGLNPGETIFTIGSPDIKKTLLIKVVVE